MNGALGYFVLRNMANGVRRGLEALRRPSRLLGLVVGLGYLAWLARHAGAGVIPNPAQATLLGALGLLVLTATAWLLGTVGTSARSDAVRALLLPAPVSDRALVALSLVVGQAIVLPNVALWTLLGSRGTTPLVLLLRAGGLWLLFTTIMCHRALVARVRGESGPRWLRRAGTIFGLMLLACIPFVLTGSFDLSAGGWKDLAPRGALAFILAPFEVPVRPLVAPDSNAWLRAAAPAALILAAHVVLLLGLGPSRQPAHAGGRIVGPALSLPRAGAISLVAWKAVTATLRRDDLVRLSVMAVAGAAGLRALHAWGSGAAAEFAGFLALTWAPLVLVLGPQFLRTGLRRDSGRIPLLRTLPSPGRSWILGGAAGGALLTVIPAGALLVVGLAGAGGSEELGIAPGLRPAAAMVIVLLLAPVAAMATLVQDGLFLYFPGPLTLGTPQAGATRLGTTLVNSVFSAALLVLLLALPFLAAVATGTLLPGPPAVRIVLAGCVAAAGMMAETVVIAAWLGTKLDHSGAA